MQFNNPLKKSRINRNRRTSSANRARRSKASAGDTPRPTSSKTRATTKGTSKKVTTGQGETALEKFERIKRANAKLRSTSGAHGPKTPPVQGPYQRLAKGMLGSRGGPNNQKVPTPGTKARPASNNRKPTQRGKVTAESFLKISPKHQRMTAAAARLVNPRGDVPSKIGAAVALVEAATSSDSGSKPKAKMRKAPGVSKKAVAQQDKQIKDAKKKDKARNKKFSAKSFDNAFAAARKAGKKEFTWRGKRYNTKVA